MRKPVGAMVPAVTVIWVIAILGIPHAAAQNCRVGTLPVWVQHGSTVQLGCTSVALSTTKAQLNERTVAPAALLLPQYNQQNQINSWTLQPGMDLNSAFQSLDKTLKQMQSAEKADKATIQALQKQVTSLQASLQKISNQPKSANQNPPDSSDENQNEGSSKGTGKNTGKSSPDKNASVFYAPFEVKSKATGNTLFRVVDNGKGGRLLVFDSGGAEVASIGTSPNKGNGSTIVQTPDGNSQVALGFSGNMGFLLIGSNGKKWAELAPGTRSPMGLRIWNGNSQEVITLETMPDGNGGLKIGNKNGGAASMIAPNKDGVGVFYGITLPLMP